MDLINKEIDEYMKTFKSRITKIDDIDELKKFIADYEILKIQKKPSDKCEACTSNGKRCSRNKKGLGKFCGIHAVSLEDKKKINEIERVNIQGIYYYIDKTGNVYNPKDMMEGRETKIGKLQSM